TFIINSQIGDESIDSCVKEVSGIINSANGTVLRENRIGGRRLAYEIDRQTHGYYVSLIFDGENRILELLDRHFKLGDNFLRSLTVRYDGDPFRKSVTDIMMGFESERRARSDTDGDRAESPRDGNRPPKASFRSDKPAPVTKTSADTVSESVGEPAVESGETSEPEPAATPVTEPSSAAQEDESTL
ncbi:MAG: 30S ribosomal protein S6, partial [Candidatus Zixiibacteriota bacterium]